MTHSFIVRIWHEALDGEGKIVAWRGSIDHVSSGKRLYFHKLEEVEGFIQEQTGLDPSRPGPGWKSTLAWIVRKIARDDESFQRAPTYRD